MAFVSRAVHAPSWLSPTRVYTPIVSRRTWLLSRHMSTPASLPARLQEADSPVQLLSDGTMRIVQLNREKALNAIDENMIDLIHEAFDEIEPSPNAATVLFRGKGRAMCAGGDIRSIVEAAAKTDMKERIASARFFQGEIMQNYRVHTMRKNTTQLGHPKTYIGLWDGIVMGGGVGMTVHGPIRVATDRTLWAMPETAIGYFPDVGLLYTFSRLDGGVGAYLALTGQRLSGADTYLIGLATHYVRSSLVEEMLRRLSTMPMTSAVHEEAILEAIEEFTSDPFEDDPSLLPTSMFLRDRRIAMDITFSRKSVEQILLALDDLAQRRDDTPVVKELWARGAQLTAEVVEWAAETAGILRERSPRALKVTLRGLQRSRDQTLAENMHMNMRLSTAFCDLSIGRDFYTGVNHVLGKDPNTGKRRTGMPPWDPARLEDVTDEYMDTFFFGDYRKACEAGLQLELLKLENVPHTGKSREARKARDAEVRGVGPLGWHPQHNPNALPSEAELAALYEGSHPAAGSYVLEPAELLDVITRHKHHKPGVRTKVQDWLDRRSRAVAAGATSL
ncbi:3-hydroxyisobutyryl-CoA hydrolase [Malassezia nana]|uniref:3-hydroxyisobutyryl-CoA hydrolase n=1 Tax=Malassezia nana TaxID=180528 RepID=A0AAF0EK93_9BASI|nr:3-hydroxyisobutyryl-CoA hydrolase [Malassezia nana]